ncbi:MAG: S41 family peptidase [bacterium]|nr:S41 family peptidase [bacterium]
MAHKRFASCIVALLSLLMFGGFFSLSVSAETSHRAVSSGKQPLQRTAHEKFKEIWNIISREHPYLKHHGPRAQVICLQKMLVGGLSYCLNDPHSYYMTRAEVAAQKIFYNTGNRMDIGLELISLLGLTVVSGLIPNSPSDRSGLFQTDDIIVEINGKNMRKAPIDVIMHKMHGPPGTPVTVRVEREGKLREPVTLLREVMPIRSLVVEDIDDDITYIGIYNFNPSVVRELFTEIAKRVVEIFQNEYFEVYPDAKKFVLDLRNNPGGFINTVGGMSALFADNPKHIILTATSRHGQKVFRVGNFEMDGIPLGMFRSLHMILLVNKKTASAGEIFAAFMHEVMQTLRVGNRTYGKGTMQGNFTLKDGDALHLTIAEYSVGNARIKINNRGIVPEYEVDNPEFISADGQYPRKGVDLDRDLQLKKAIELLREMPVKE